MMTAWEFWTKTEVGKPKIFQSPDSNASELFHHHLCVRMSLFPPGVFLGNVQLVGTERWFPDLVGQTKALMSQMSGSVALQLDS